MMVGPTYQTKAQMAASTLRAAIQSGTLAPGERIDLEALAGSLHMSATPIREAIRQLAAEGLIVGEPHQRVHVADFSASDVSSLYDLRALLETYATRVATGVLTDDDIMQLKRLTGLHRDAVARNDGDEAIRVGTDFHFQIYRAAGTDGSYLLDFISRLWKAFPWATTWIVPGQARSVKDHREILAAIQARDGDRAAELMRGHIVAGREMVINRLRETSEPVENWALLAAGR